MRRSVIGLSLFVLLLLPQLASGQSERARIGAQTVGNLEIALYIWGPQQVIHPKGSGHPEAAAPATHHLDVRVYDLRRGIYIPYLNVKATISDLPTKREFAVELTPMIGEWIHYGANITLPHPGRYAILVTVDPPDIARYKHLADVWNTRAEALFEYDYR